MWRASELTIGIATVATIVPATSGPTMVDVVPSSQVKPASSAKTPTSNHDVLPRSFSQRGAANVELELPGVAGAQLERLRLRGRSLLAQVLEKAHGSMLRTLTEPPVGTTPTP